MDPRNKKDNNFTFNDNDLSKRHERSPLELLEAFTRLDIEKLIEVSYTEEIEVHPTYQKIFEETQTYYVNITTEEKLTDEEELLRLIKLRKQSLEKISELMGIQLLEVIGFTTIKMKEESYEDSIKKIEEKKKVKKVIEIKPEHKKLLEQEKLYNIIFTNGQPEQFLTDSSLQKIVSLMGLDWYEVLNYMQIHIIKLNTEKNLKRKRRYDLLIKKIVEDYDEPELPHEIFEFSMKLEDSKKISKSDLLTLKNSLDNVERFIKEKEEKEKEQKEKDQKEKEQKEQEEKELKEKSKKLKSSKRIEIDQEEHNKVIDEYEEVEDKSNVKRLVKKMFLKNILEWQEVEDKDGEIRLVKKVDEKVHKYIKKGSAIISKFTDDEVEVIDEEGLIFKIRSFILNEKNRVKNKEGEWFEYINTEGEFNIVRRKSIHLETFEDIKEEEKENIKEETKEDLTRKNNTKFTPRRDYTGLTLINSKILINDNRILAERLNHKNKFSVWEDISFLDNLGIIHQDGKNFDFKIRKASDIPRHLSMVNNLNNMKELKPIIITPEGYKLLDCPKSDIQIVVDPSKLEEKKREDLIIKKKLYISLLYPVNFYLNKIKEQLDNNQTENKEIIISNDDNENINSIQNEEIVHLDTQSCTPKATNNVINFEEGKSYLEFIRGNKDSKEVNFKMTEDLVSYYYNISNFENLLEEPSSKIRLNNLHSDIKLIKKSFHNVVNLNYLHRAYESTQLSIQMEMRSFNQIFHLRNISRTLILRNKVEPTSTISNISYKEFICMKEKLITF